MLQKSETASYDTLQIFLAPFSRQNQCLKFSFLLKPKLTFTTCPTLHTYRILPTF